MTWTSDPDPLTLPESGGEPHPAHTERHLDHVYRWSEVKAWKRGGPTPACRFCGVRRPGKRSFRSRLGTLIGYGVSR